MVLVLLRSTNLFLEIYKSSDPPSLDPQIRWRPSNSASAVKNHSRTSTAKPVSQKCIYICARKKTPGTGVPGEFKQGGFTSGRRKESLMGAILLRTKVRGENDAASQHRYLEDSHRRNLSPPMIMQRTYAKSAWLTAVFSTLQLRIIKRDLFSPA